MAYAKRFLKFTPHLYLIFITLWLRFANLGYSDYQGDEIKALYLPKYGQSIIDFFLSQRKGPLQFIMTYITKLFDPLYTNEFLNRLPFAVSNTLAIFFFYKLVKRSFGSKIALYATILLATNGIVLAFARIIQYQSLVILFSVLALYMFSLAASEKNWKSAGIYFGMIFWTLSILSHYDGIFIAPLAIYFLYKYWRENTYLTKAQKIADIAFASLISAALLLTFYLPFVLSIGEATKAYWLDRLAGGSQKISSSIITFKVYNPKFMFYIYSLMFAVSFVRFKRTWPVFVWLLFPFIFMEIVANVPGTHIYTYLIPASILAAVGIEVVENTVSKIVGSKYGLYLNTIGLATFFVFVFYLSHKVFVDHTREYPWEDEEFLVWKLRRPNPIFHLSMFGFPYYRHWEEIGEYVTSGENKASWDKSHDIFFDSRSEPNNTFYSTNERNSISRYYIPFQKDTDSAGHYIYIYNPQSFTIKTDNEKANYWMANYRSIKTFSNNGKIVSEIYYMPAGDLNTLRQSGY